MIGLVDAVVRAVTREWARGPGARPPVESDREAPVSPDGLLTPDRLPTEVLPRGVALRSSRWLTGLGGRLARMRGPASAVTLGRTIVVHPDAELSERLLRHELEHVRQWERHPVTFPILYILHHLRYGYRDNPYEIEARKAEVDRYRREP